MFKKVMYSIIFFNLCGLFFSLNVNSYAEELTNNYSNPSANDIVQPTGDESVGYPQVCIRTNAQPTPLDFDKISKDCDDLADALPFPYDNDGARALAVETYLSQIIGNGSLGHAWVIVFNSDKPNDYVSYSFWEGVGYVSNHNPKAPGAYDPSNRSFIAQKSVKLPNNMNTTEIENNLIPQLIEESNAIGIKFGTKENIVGNGTFTPLTTCAWFSGNLWNRIYSAADQVEFTSPFSNSEMHAKKWGIPGLSGMKEIANPGALSKFILK